jgi:hypothetical protein
VFLIYLLSHSLITLPAKIESSLLVKM